MNIKKILVSGHFNILHTGHLRLFKFAKELGGLLIVAIEGDLIAGKDAHMPEKLRLESVDSIGYVDECFIFNNDISSVIKKVRPDIVIKGKEFEGKFNPETEALAKYGGKLIFSSGEVLLSSLEIIQKEYEIIKKKNFELPINYIERHKIDIYKIPSLIRRFGKLNICVIGDLIVDEYITCDALGMSQEDPTIVVTPVDSKKFIGGAAIVAAHAASLGANVHFITVAGNDDERDFVSNNIKKLNINLELLVDESRPTTLKKRYRCKGKTLLRVSHLHQGEISKEKQKVIINLVEKLSKNLDLMVFSDFNYGCLPQTLVRLIVKKLKNKGILMAADSQSSSQIGDLCRFKEMDLVTPTEREARISIKNNNDGLVILAEKFRKKSLAKNVLLKMGEEGVLIQVDRNKDSNWTTDKLPALNNLPKDVSGAGDSMLIVAALTLAVGGNIWESALLGSIAAAVQVSRLGNTPLKTEELIREFNI